MRRIVSALGFPASVVALVLAVWLLTAAAGRLRDLVTRQGAPTPRPDAATAFRGRVKHVAGSTPPTWPSGADIVNPTLKTPGEPDDE